MFEFVVFVFLFVWEFRICLLKFLSKEFFKFCLEVIIICFFEFVFVFVIVFIKFFKIFIVFIVNLFCLFFRLYWKLLKRKIKGFSLVLFCFLNKFFSEYLSFLLCWNVLLSVLCCFEFFNLFVSLLMNFNLLICWFNLIILDLGKCLYSVLVYKEVIVFFFKIKIFFLLFCFRIDIYCFSW